MRISPRVRLLTHTPEPTRAMALAARLCYVQGMSIAEVDRSLSDADCERLVRRVVESRHLSILEHASFMFGVEGVSRNFSHQMVRHRNTSYEQQSLHYTMAREGFGLAEPRGLDERPVAANLWEKAREASWQCYSQLTEMGYPKEDARHILPSGIETRLVMTMNLRQLMHFVEVRACVVNCREILVVAMKVKKLVEEVVPYMRDYLGPTCWSDGVCREGKKFCGHPWRDTCVVSGFGVKPYTWQRKVSGTR